MCGDKIFLLPSTSSNAIICVNQKICSQEFPSILSALYIQLEQYENENAVSKQKISFKMTFHILFFLHRSNQTCAAVCEFKVCAKSKKKERKKENFQCKNMCPSTEGIMRCKMAKWLWRICTPCRIEISVISFIQLNQPLRWLSHSLAWQQWKNGLLIVKTSLDELILLHFHFIFIFRLLKQILKSDKIHQNPLNQNFHWQQQYVEYSCTNEDDCSRVSPTDMAAQVQDSLGTSVGAAMGHQ